MELASLEGIPFFSSAGQMAAVGGAFALGQRSPISQVIPLADGWEVELRSGARSVVVRGEQLCEYTHARNLTVSRAQEALDWLSLHHAINLSIQQIDEDQTTWWTKHQGIVLRMTCILTMPALSFASPAAGQKQQLGQTVSNPIDWHQSYRYFRLAQTTEDTFDAFRNLYLALESLLESIRPVQTKHNERQESEGEWLKAALATVGATLDLRPFALPGPDKPESRIINEIYKGRRNPIFHAKSSGNPLLPGEYMDRSAVAESLRRLTGLYIALAETFRGLQRPEVAGYLSRMTHRMMLEDRVRSVYVSDLSKVNEWDAVIKQNAEARVVPLLTKRTRDLNKTTQKDLYSPFMASFLASIDVGDLANLAGITQIWTQAGDDKPTLNFILDGSGLTLGGVDRLEVHLGLRLTDHASGRDVFST
jgi:hypothetical protein